MEELQARFNNSASAGDKNLLNRLAGSQGMEYSSKMSVPKSNPVSSFAPIATQTQSATPQAVQAQTGAQPVQAVPLSGANGVNIVIYNPTVQPPNGTSNTTNNYNTTQNSYPKEYYTKELGIKPQEAIPASKITTQEQKPEQKIEQKATENKDKKEIKQKEIVALTDEYIKTLENYIKNPNPEIRLMGVKELQKRFIEDETRRYDAALTNLLNVSLQDNNDGVRLVALTVLDGGAAQGDKLTYQILNNIQNKKSQNQYDATTKSDALLASEILLKLSGNKVKVDDPTPKKDEKAKG